MIYPTEAEAILIALLLAIGGWLGARLAEEMEGEVVAFDRIKPGDVLYDCHREKAGNTTMTRMGTWTVRVKEVDYENRRALVSWNGNSAKWWSEGAIKKLRRTPVKKRDSF